MELVKFKKKCDKCYGSQKMYFVIFDRYHYYECYQTYEEIKNTIKLLTKPRPTTYIKTEECCIKETELYLTHLDSMYKLKNMGYTQIF
jgi:hypothetical protein